MERLGCDLCEEDRNYVLRAYVNRYTRSHVPAWARSVNGGTGVLTPSSLPLIRNGSRIPSLRSV